MLTPPPYSNPVSSAAAPPFIQLLARQLPEDVAEKQGSPISQSPVVIQGVDGGCQWLQDAVEDTAHQGADVGPQAEVWVSNQAPRHLQEPVQLLQIMAHRFHLLVGEGCLGGRQGTQQPAVLMAPAMSPVCCWASASPQSVPPCPSLLTHPTDHIDKVRQECCDLGVGLQVLESNLKRKGPDCAASPAPGRK